MSGKVAVLGGGISGLSAAYYLINNSATRAVEVIEATNRTGGWVRTRVSPSGACFEEGPRTIRPRGPGGINTLNLIDGLKLTDQIIPIGYNHPAAKNRMIYVGEKLHKLPNSWSSMFRVNAPFNRPLVGCLFTDLLAPRLTKDDESIYGFVERRLGTDMADYLISPVICGICAGDAKQISVNFLMKSLFDYEQEYGSIVRGYLANKWKTFLNQSKNKHGIESTLSKKHTFDTSTQGRAAKEGWSVWTLRGGLEQLPTIMTENIQSKGVDISLNTKCDELTFFKDYVKLKLDGKTENYTSVISSLSAKQLARLVGRQHPKLAHELIAIPTVDVAVVNLEFIGNVLEEEAFGFLVPPRENLPILGVIFDSCILPSSNSTILTVMMGGAWFRNNFGDRPSEERLLSTAVNHVKNILKIEQNPIAHNVAILSDCIPQYVVGHAKRITFIEKYLTEHKLPLSLCGSSYYGVGLNDVILSAKQAASAFFQ